MIETTTIGGRMRARSIVVVITLAASVLAVSGSARSQAACAPAGHPGGDWPSYGGNPAGTRSQDAEDVISPGTVTSLTPAWTFNTATQGDAADVFAGTPVEADGCVFVGAGSVYALNADTGELVWKTAVPGGAALGTTLAVDGGRVFLHGSTDGHPSVTALDQTTGAVLWTRVVSERQNASFSSSASPVAFDGLVFSGIVEGLEFTEEFRRTTQGSFAILDAFDGSLLAKTPVIPDADFEDGYTGGNIWATAAVDRELRFAYVGTAAPYSAQKEHERTNAILKIDVDPSRDTFGEIVASRKGTPDYYFHFQEQVPCVPLIPGSNAPLEGTGECMKQDIDFGASPNLFTGPDARLKVGELQKSGIYHVWDAEMLDPEWETMIAPPPGGSTLNSTAVDASGIYGSGSYMNNTFFALDKVSGDYRWFSASPDNLRASPVAVANGVVFSPNTDGLLTAHDARTGVLLLARPISLDAGTVVTGLGTGVAIARNTVYTNGGGAVVAYTVDPALPDLSDAVSEVPAPPTLPRQGQPPL